MTKRLCPEGCTEKYFAKGRCLHHYNAKRVRSVKYKNQREGRKLEPSGEGVAVGRRFRATKRNAAHKGISFSLTKEQYIALVKPDTCFYDGSPLPKYMGGLDRIDSSLGYTPENCRPCCKSCNMAKNTMTDTEFKAWISRIYTHWVQGKGIA